MSTNTRMRYRIRMREAESYRLPMLVNEYYIGHYGIFMRYECCIPKCPRCSIGIDRDYQSYCDRCGQALDWRDWMNEDD